ncbi:MAG TPA: methyltransferase domain-containing protein [Cerasibacillus sp.]|uniref:putative RNA methyltransferase n=1 Tax=Cerasibacillus sp. TaxID=2498711 RepID=UPI002F41538E
MTTKEKSAKLVNQHVHIFRCPLCKEPMQVVELESLICINKHTFDFSKQGYVNMLTRAVKSQYDKTLFESRQQIIMDSDLFGQVHKEIANVVKQYINDTNTHLHILDAGCGEGSHLQRILDECNNKTIIGIGLDISKEGVLQAAKNYKESIWFVGDLAATPLVDQSCDIILNILSPANYEEFKRILAPGGLVVKVVPRRNYLKELREVRFGETEKTSYNNDEAVSLFKKHFDIVHQFTLSYTKVLNKSELENLVHMSPLAWNLEKEDMKAFVNQETKAITVDLDILIGEL